VQLTGKEPGASLDFRCFWGSVPRGSALDDVCNKCLASTQAVFVQLAPQEPARWTAKRQALHIFPGSGRFGNYRKQRVQRACGPHAHGDCFLMERATFARVSRPWHLVLPPVLFYGKQARLADREVPIPSDHISVLYCHSLRPRSPMLTDRAIEPTPLHIVSHLVNTSTT